MKKKAKKLSKAKIWAIISASVVAVVAVAIIIANIFIPIKYLSSYFVAGKRSKNGILRISFIDVGYGDCTIIELPDGKSMLIDAGDGRYSNNLKIIKELNRRDIDKIDYLVCSSVNGEHCGGLSEIMKYKQVETVYMPYCTNKYITEEFRKFYEAVQEQDTRIIYSEYKTGIETEDYFFTFLSPSVKELAGGEYSILNSNPSKTARNNSSAVVWLEYGEFAILFTSDVETKILNAIAQAYEIAVSDYPADLKKCKIMQVACHGNAKSACAEFYDLLRPEAAIISVGENASGCPSVQVMSDVINSVGENLFRTDELGIITIEVTAANYLIN